MNIRRVITISTVLAAFQFNLACKPRVESENSTRLYSRVVTRRDQLSSLQRVLPKPIARAERPVVYEGEDIWLIGAIPGSVNPDTLYKAVRRREWLPTMIRVFAGRQELTDSLLPTPVSCIPQWPRSWKAIKTGDSATWRITGLFPGEYWGVLDAGVMSDRFAIHVETLPDSLKSICDWYFRLYGMQYGGNNPRSPRRISEEFWPEIREYANMLIPHPGGTPLRMEGLRLCTRHLPTPGLRYYEDADSLLMFRMLREYVREPRHQRENLIWALQRLCANYPGDSCLIQLAQNSGDEMIHQEVMEWYIESQKKAYRARKVDGTPKPN
jgi:hypothetical protein